MTLPGDSKTDELLVSRVLSGEKEVFRELVERHKNVVFGSLMRLCGNRELAEELTQETFVRAYTSLRSFRFEARLSTWLVQIAANCASSYFSSRDFRVRKRSIRFEQEIHAGQAESAERQIELQSRLEK